MAHSQLPIWIEYLQALGPTSIAVAVGFIAYRQWATARDRVKLDLFDRRYAVYQELRTLLATALQDGTINYEAVRMFARTTRGLEFLFGGEVEDYLEGLMKTLNSWAYHAGQVRQRPEVANYEMHVDKSFELASSVTDELTKNARPIFEKYLSFSHLK
jgi:hypothetical protein